MMQKSEVTLFLRTGANAYDAGVFHYSVLLFPERDLKRVTQEMIFLRFMNQHLVLKNAVRKIVKKLLERLDICIYLQLILAYLWLQH